MATSHKADSEKLRILDNTFQKSERIPFKIKNTKYKKSQRTFYLSEFIVDKRKPKKRHYQYSHIIYKNRKVTGKKHKYRPSKLKKNILKTREEKQFKIRNHEGTEEKSELPELTENFSNLTINISYKNKLHSRRFRDYCDNFSSKELCMLVEKVLRELFHFQKRTYQINQYKGRYRRRIVIGFREVQAQLRLDKLKLVVIATDCEKCDVEGGLDCIIAAIKNECENRNVPCAFALQRRQISYALCIRPPVSCVGIKDYDGVQDVFLSLLKTLEQDKCRYKKSLEETDYVIKSN